MWRSDSDWNTASIQAAVEGGDQVDSCTPKRNASVTNASQVSIEITRERAELGQFTWRVDQGHVVSCVEASHQGSSHSLCTLVQLQTGSCARHGTLKRTEKNKSPIIPTIRVTSTFPARSQSRRH